MKRWFNWQKQMKRIVVFCILVAMAFSSMGSYVSAESFIQSPETEAIEIETLREPNAKHFQLPDGTMEYVVYGTRIHYSDGDGKYQEISSRIIEDPVTIQEEQYLYRNEANDIVLRFAESTENAEYPVYFSWEDKTIGIRFNGNSSTATQEYVLPKYMQEANVLENMVIYPDVQPGIDYVYEATGSGLKESLIIRERQEQNEFSFEYCVDGLSVENTEAGLVFKNDTGDIIMESGRLYAFDEAESSTNEVYCTLDELGDNQYRVTIGIDQEWLEDEDRIYPIVIDPTIIMTGFHNTYDACICSIDPNHNYSGEEDLRTGYDTDFGTRQTVIRFPINSTIFATAVTNASLRIYKHSGAAPQMRAYRITSGWSSSTVTWNTKPNHTTNNQSPIATYLGNNWYSMTITDIVKMWLNGIYNYGVILIDSNESNTDGNHWSTYFSSEATNTAKVPRLQINYNGTFTSASYTGTTSGANGYSVAVMQGNSDNPSDTINYYNKFSNYNYTTSSYGFYPSSGVSSNRATRDDFLQTGLANDICVFSGHGDSSGSHPVLNYYNGSGVPNYDFDVAEQLGVDGSTTYSVWQTAPIEVLVLAACSQLDISIVPYYARIMKNSGIRAIVGYHEASNDHPSDAIVATSFVTLAVDTGYSVKYSWEYANTTSLTQSGLETEDWAVLVYAVDPLYCIIGSDNYSANHATGGTIYRYTNNNPSSGGTISLNSVQDDYLFSNSPIEQHEYSLYLYMSDCTETERAFSELDLNNREAVDPETDLPDYRAEADVLANKCLNIEDDIILSESEIKRDIVTVDGVQDDSALVVGRSYTYRDSYKGVPILDSYIRFSFDSQGVYMSCNRWKTYEPSSETIIVSSEMIEAVKDKSIEEGMKKENLEVSMVYKSIDESLSKLYFRTFDGEKVLLVDPEEVQ